jgi:hypothetical protein
VTQLVVIVQVFVAECDRAHTLADQRYHLMLDQMRLPLVVETPRNLACDCPRSDIIEPPAHGTLHTSTTTGFVTYVPAPGFIRHDRFEVIYKWTNFIQPISAVYKAEVTITP